LLKTAKNKIVKKTEYFILHFSKDQKCYHHFCSSSKLTGTLNCAFWNAKFCDIILLALINRLFCKFVVLLTKLFDGGLLKWGVAVLEGTEELINS
jgi:hypothetical protein